MTYVELPQHRDYPGTMHALTKVFSELRKERGNQHRVPRHLRDNPPDEPTLIFDLYEIEQKMHGLKKVAGEFDAQTLLAVKSMPVPLCLEVASRLLDGFDVSNQHEYGLLPASLEGKLVSVTSPSMRDNPSGFLNKGNDGIFTVDSPVQLQQFIDGPHDLPYLLRIQTSDLILRDDETVSRFGFTAAQILDDIKPMLNCARRPSGFHVHHGGESNANETYKQMIRSLVELSERSAIDLDFLNLGGGWHELSCDDIREVLAFARNQLPERCKILLEPGHYFSQNSGFGTGRIVNRTVHGDAIHYTVNLSKQCHLRWSEPTLICAAEKDARQMKEVRFYGPSCYEGDLLGSYLVPFTEDLESESGLSIGQQVIFGAVNSYSAALNTGFNGIPPASVQWRH